MCPHCGERRLLPVARIVFRQIPEEKVRGAHAVVPYRADEDSPCTGQRDQETLLLARQYSRKPRIMPGFVAFFKRSPQHELGKVFTTEHGVAPGEVRPHVLLDHRYPRIFPVASGRACRRSQCHRVFHRSYVGQESACTSMPRTCAMNDVMSRLAVESSANWNRRIAASSRSLAVRPSAVLNNAARCQTGARPVAFHATDSA